MGVDDNKKRDIKEIVGTILIMSLYTLVGINFGMIMLVIFPVAFIIIAVRKGMLQGLLSMVITLLIVGLLAGEDIALFLFLILVPMTMVLGYSIRKRKAVSLTLGLTTAVLFISIFLIVGVLNLSGIDFASQLQEGFKTIINSQVEILSDMGLTSYETLKSINLLEMTYRYFILTIPTLTLMLSLGLSYINYSISVNGLTRLGIPIVHRPRFSKFRLPNNIIQGISIMLLGTFIIMKMEISYYETIFINIISLFCFMFLIQGFSVIDHLLVKMKLNRIFRVIFLILSLFAFPLLIMIFSVGFADVIFDFRRLRKLKS